VAFNIRAFAENSARVRFDDVNYDAFVEQPLSSDALRTLRYMSDVESHTICYLRDLLVTPSHKDPEITAFLTHWAYEEFWHGEALDKVLRMHGIPADYGHIRNVRLAQGPRDRISPINQAVMANVIGEDFVAVHMSWGAINEWSAHSAYARMVEREDHPELAKLLRRVQAQESRHLAFYASQAKERLARSVRAQKLTRWAMRNFWGPVGSTIEPRHETSFVLDYLLGGPKGGVHVERIDAKMDELPGMANLHLVRNAFGRFGVGPGATSAPRIRLHALPDQVRLVGSRVQLEAGHAAGRAGQAAEAARQRAGAAAGSARQRAGQAADTARQAAGQAAEVARGAAEARDELPAGATG